MAGRKQVGIFENAPGRFVVQVQVGGRRATARVKGTRAEAQEARLTLLQKLRQEVRPSQEGNSSSEPLGQSASSRQSLADWLTGRYARWQERAQNERTRRKIESPKRYLIASDLGEKPLNEISTADVNAYVEWRLQVGMLTFARRKDGRRYKARKSELGSQTINKSLKVLSAALRLACDEEGIAKVPKIECLPEADAKAIMPPTEDEY